VICDEVERDLDAYVDRELAADSAAAVRTHLSTCAPCQQRVADREALGRLVRSLPYYEAPDRLRARVSAQVPRQRSTRRLLLGWAAAAVLVVAVGGGISVVRSRAARGDALVEDVVNGHLRSLMAEHLFDVRSTDQHTVKPWFLGKLDFSPPVVDLAAVGFPLVGGRLDYVSGRPVAALVYQRQKHTINVFVWPASDASPAVRERAVRGFHVRHWMRDGMSFWAVSDLNDAELTEFARALQAA
jgi:anti-sigma factor (TIGR02949 family)